MCPECAFNLNGSCLYVSHRCSSLYLCIIYICIQNACVFLWLPLCEWFLFSFIFIIYEHIKKYLFIFMQQFVRREAATNAGAKKYFNAAPARMQRFFHKFTCCPLCVCMWEWHQVVFLCVWQRRGNGKCMSELKWRSSISHVLVSKGFCGVRNDIQVFYISFHSN